MLASWQSRMGPILIPETEINMAAVSDNMGSKDKDIIMAKGKETYASVSDECFI